MSEKQEFPKALYLHGACRVVGNEDEQAAAEAEGHTDWHADQDRMNEAAAAETAQTGETAPAPVAKPAAAPKPAGKKAAA